MFFVSTNYAYWGRGFFFLPPRITRIARIKLGTFCFLSPRIIVSTDHMDYTDWGRGLLFFVSVDYEDFPYGGCTLSLDDFLLYQLLIINS